MEEHREESAPEQEKKPEKSGWQATKESWYDKIPLNLKQLDIIVGICWTLLILTFVGIILDAVGVF